MNGDGMSIFGTGVHTLLKNKKLIFIFYALNLFSALIVALPLRSMLDNFAGRSLAGKALAEQFDLSLVFEMMNKNAAAAPVTIILLMIAGSVYWLMHLFFSGGAYGLFLRDERYATAEFWSLSGQFFGRFIRLFLWSIPLFAIFYSLQFLETAFVRIVFGKDPYQNIVYWGAIVRTGLGYLGILLYLLVFDYARIHTVHTDERKMRKALWCGVVFLFRHFFVAFALGVAVFLAEMLILVLYNPLAGALLSPNAVTVFFLFILQQIYIIARVKLRLLLYAMQSSYYLNVSPEPSLETNLPGDIIDANPLLLM
jgi:hypothetical protein